MSHSRALVSAVCTALALLAMANACCLPHKFVMNFIGEVDEEYYGAKKIYNITGSIGANFYTQKFSLQYSFDSRVKEILILEPLQDKFLHTRQVNHEPAVCHVAQGVDGYLNMDYRCFLGNKKLVKTIGKTYKLKLGKSMKMTGFLQRSSEYVDICELQGLQTFSLVTGSGKALRVGLLVTSFMTGPLIDVTPTCTEQRPLSQNVITIPLMATFSKMSGKGIASMFSKLWSTDVPAVPTTARPTTTTSTTAEPTTSEPATAEPTIARPWVGVTDGDVVQGGSGSGNGGDDDDDDNTDGTIVDESSSGSGNGDTDDEDGSSSVGVEPPFAVPTTAEPTTARPTTIEPTTEKPITPTPGGRYVWQGNSWAWVIDEVVVQGGSGSSDGGDDDDDDNTDGTIVDESSSGSGNGDTDDEDDDGDKSESKEEFVNDSGHGDVDGDGDYDDYDREYWSYYWKDEDQAIEDWEAQYDGR
ncbi:uncharacterized protein LOC135497878 [Lineus longissimus]|uniref:uncharacterized protein LOC135497878 n=1 Tax=Lineus longissimus TaxID=88925 RepID=UPI002B4C8A3A